MSASGTVDICKNILNKLSSRAVFQLVLVNANIEDYYVHVICTVSYYSGAQAIFSGFSSRVPFSRILSMLTGFTPE